MLAQATSIAREAVNNIRTVQALNAQEQITSHFSKTLHKPSKAKPASRTDGATKKRDLPGERH